MPTTKLTKLLLPFTLVFLLLAACAPQTPVVIRITRTPPTGPAVVEATSIPELSPVPAEETEEPAAAEATEEAEATDEATPQRPFGPVISPDYTPPPTETPRPTEVPATATPTPTHTPARTPVATPLAAWPALDPNSIGLQLYQNVERDDWGELLWHAGQLRAGWIKLQANWSFLQPGGPDDFGQEFALFQLQVQDADRQGFKILVSVAKAPNWARPSNQNEDGPPDNPQDLVNFINLLLEKVGPNIDAIEIWNEPNLIREWTGALPFSGAGYMQLFARAYAAIRAYSPDMIIVTAGLAPTGDSNGSIDDRDFLLQMYTAGLGRYRDIAVGIHPYGWGNPPDTLCCHPFPDRGWDDDPHFFFLNNLNDYRAIMVANGHGDVQMWATEFGWATWEGVPSEPPQPWMDYNSTQDQAHYTMRALQIGQQRGDMGPMFIWNLNFANNVLVDQRHEIAAYSIFMPAEIRPLYYALRDRP